MARVRTRANSGVRDMVTVVVSHVSCPQAHAVGLSGRPLAMSVPAVLVEPLPATVPAVYSETKPAVFRLVATAQAGMILSHVTPDGQHPL